MAKHRKSWAIEPFSKLGNWVIHDKLPQFERNNTRMGAKLQAGRGSSHLNPTSALLEYTPTI